MEIQSRITSPNGLFRFHPTFNFQILSGESFSLSHEKNCIAIIAITDGTLHISYSDDGTRDFIASIYNNSIICQILLHRCTKNLIATQGCLGQKRLDRCEIEVLKYHRKHQYSQYQHQCHNLHSQYSNQSI